MSTNVIPVSQAQANHLFTPNPPKETQSKSGIKYTRTYFQYNYGTQEQPRPAQPFFDVGKVNATLKKTVREDSGRVAWKLNFAVEDPATIAGLNELDMGIKQTVFKYKGLYKQFSFAIENPGDLKGCFFYPRNEAGDLIEGANPIMSLKVDGESFFKKLIPHYDEEGKIKMNDNGMPQYSEEFVDYKSLENHRFECGVVFKMRDLYHGGSGMPVPQVFVGTCWILSTPTQKGSVDFSQSSTIMSFLKDQNPEELDALADKINSLKMQKQSSSSLLTSKPDAPAQSGSTSSDPSIDLTSYMQQSGQMQPQQQGGPPPQWQQNAQMPPAQQQQGGPPPQWQQQNTQMPQPQLDLSAYMQESGQQSQGTVIHRM